VTATPQAPAPLLCITVTEESGATPEQLATLVAAQQLDDVVILYSSLLSPSAVDGLRSLPFPAEALFQGEVDLRRYWSLVLERFRQADGSVLVLDAISEAPAACWRRFAASTLSARCICFPQSVRGAASTVFSTNSHEPGLAAPQLDRWLGRYVRGAVLDLPEPAGFSGLLLNPGSDAAPRYVLDDAVFVDDRRRDPLPLRDDLPLAYRDALSLRHPDTALRHAMTELSERREPPPADLPPVQAVRLHIAHGWGGGLEHWVEDFASSDSEARSLILKPVGDRSAYGQTLAVYEPGRSQPLLWRTLAMPIISTDVAHEEYRRVLAEIIDTFAVTSLFVSSLIGHALDVLDAGLPTVMVVHNFFPSCPAILASFDGPCESCGPSRMEACFAGNPQQRFFKVESAQRWHAVRAAFAERLHCESLRLVAPSASALERLGLLTGDGSALPGCVIEHGLRAEKARALMACREQSPAGGDRLRIVVLGGQEPHKGSAMLEALLATTAEIADFVLLGFGKPTTALERAPNVTVIERFDNPELPALFTRYRPDLGLLLSTVPETFSYTLSELQCAAIPVIATDLGAFRDRIDHGHSGWLVPPSVDSVRQQLYALHQDRAALDQVREHLRQQQPRTTETMVRDYLALLPKEALIPARRPQLRIASKREEAGVLLIDPGARFVEVCASFYRYALRKALHSPRVPAPLKSALGALTPGSRRRD
jgi:hypothetical protein